jgi:hypothetical protein
MAGMHILATGNQVFSPMSLRRWCASFNASDGKTQADKAAPGKSGGKCCVFNVKQRHHQKLCPLWNGRELVNQSRHTVEKFFGIRHSIPGRSAYAI